MTYLDLALFQGRESFLVLLEELPLACLEVEPGERERLHVRQSGLYEGVKLILNTKLTPSNHTNASVSAH